MSRVPDDVDTHLRELMRRRLVYLDGAMGTAIQSLRLDEAAFRGEPFRDHPHDLKGNNDILCLTRPDAVVELHRTFLAAGADVIETNSFSLTRIAQADYGLEDRVRELNLAAAAVARRAIDDHRAAHPDDDRELFVAGALGPTNKTLSLSPDVEDPGYRAASFAEIRDAYAEQLRALIEGGVDLVLIETVFDTLNCKAAIVACEEVFEEIGRKLPLMISVTITDRSGRTLSGQTIEAFWYSVAHARPLSVGVNCALGADEMRPYVQRLGEIADCAISCYPNAGLPDPLSPTGFPEGPEDTARALSAFAGDRLLNIVGGCCGTTAEHIAAIVDRTATPRRTRSRTRRRGFAPRVWNPSKSSARTHRS